MFALVPVTCDLLYVMLTLCMLATCALIRVMCELVYITHLFDITHGICELSTYNNVSYYMSIKWRIVRVTCELVRAFIM